MKPIPQAPKRNYAPSLGRVSVFQVRSRSFFSWIFFFVAPFSGWAWECDLFFRANPDSFLLGGCRRPFPFYRRGPPGPRVDRYPTSAHSLRGPLLNPPTPPISFFLQRHSLFYPRPERLFLVPFSLRRLPVKNFYFSLTLSLLGMDLLHALLQRDPEDPPPLPPQGTFSSALVASSCFAVPLMPPHICPK